MDFKCVFLLRHKKYFSAKISRPARCPATAQPCALCRPRSRPVRRLWRSRPSVRHVVRPDVRRVLCRLPCVLCRAGCRQPFAASVSCRRTTGATVRPVGSCRAGCPGNIERRNRAPDHAARPSGLSPSKGVNLSARSARSYNSTRANVRPVARSVRPDLRQPRNRAACAAHVRGLFAACGVLACPSGTLSVPTCGASCAAYRAPCAGQQAQPCGLSAHAVPDVRRTSGLCRPRSRPARRLWRSRPSVRRVARADVRRVLCRLPCVLCRAGCRQPFAPVGSCRAGCPGNIERRNRAPDLAAQPSGLSPVRA